MSHVEKVNKNRFLLKEYLLNLTEEDILKVFQDDKTRKLIPVLADRSEADYCKHDFNIHFNVTQDCYDLVKSLDITYFQNLNVPVSVFSEFMITVLDKMYHHEITQSNDIDEIAHNFKSSYSKEISNSENEEVFEQTDWLSGYL